MSDNQKVEQGKRLRETREKLGYNQGKFAEMLELKQGSYSDIERGKNAIAINLLTFLANNLNIDVNYILTGIETDDKKDYALNNLRIIENEAPNVQFYNIEAFAGLAINNDIQELSEWLYMPTLQRGKKYIAIPVSGNSMNPSLYDEDFLICEHILNFAESFQHGKIYVAVLRDRILVKRIYMKDQHLEFRSDNPFYKTERVEVEDLLKLFRVVKVLTNPKDRDHN